MVCAKPINVKGVRYPCGRCMNCRVNKQACWVTRIMLEADCHEESIFVTLTYRDEELPMTETVDPETGEIEVLPELNKKHLQDWLKRLRWHLAQEKREVRFFAVGEYGTKTFRPHYHAILFGMDPRDEKLVHETWGKGFTSVGYGDLRKRAQYVAHYTCKKMTHGDDPRLKGRQPEFMRCSRKPGIGLGSVERLARANGYYMAKSGDEDISPIFRLDGKKQPLDYYMKGKIREALEVPRTAAERGVPYTGLDYPKGLPPERTIMGQNAKKHEEKLKRKAKQHGQI